MKLPRLRIASPRAGMTLAMVIACAFFATMIWVQQYHQLHGQITLQQRAKTGYTGGSAPDRGAAVAAALACLRVQDPVTTGNPPTATCKLTLGQGANQRVFSMKYIDRSSGLWEIEVVEGDLGYSACPACPGAGGP